MKKGNAPAAMLSGIRETYDTYQRQADQVALLESLLGDGADGLEDGTPADPLALLLARRQDQVLDHAADEAPWTASSGSSRRPASISRRASWPGKN